MQYIFDLLASNGKEDIQLAFALATKQGYPPAWQQRIHHLLKLYNIIFILYDKKRDVVDVDLVIELNQLRELKDFIPNDLSKIIGLLQDCNLIQNITKLTLKGLSNSLPECIKELSSLEELTCHGTELSILPEWIDQLKNIKKLDCANNQVTSLPESIGRLEKLEYLDCYNNQLTYLPETIGQIKALKNIQCSNNQLTSLPASLGYLLNLEILKLWGNQVSSLPDSFTHLKNLKELDCHDNLLTVLPDYINQWSKLEYLDCSYNYLVYLPEKIGNLSNLKHLIACCNYITTLPETWQLDKVTELDFSVNQLTSLPALSASPYFGHLKLELTGQ